MFPIGIRNLMPAFAFLECRCPCPIRRLIIRFLWMRISWESFPEANGKDLATGV